MASDFTVAEIRAQSVLKWIASAEDSIVHPELEVRHDKYGGLGLFIKGSREQRQRQGAIMKSEQENTSSYNQPLNDMPGALEPQTLSSPLTRSHTIFKIPRSCMIEPHSSLVNENVHPHHALAVTLLSHLAAGTKSPYAAYISSLPTPMELSSMLPLWHLDELILKKRQQQNGSSLIGGLGDEDIGPDLCNCPTLVQIILSALPNSLGLFNKHWGSILSEYQKLSCWNDILNLQPVRISRENEETSCSQDELSPPKHWFDQERLYILDDPYKLPSLKLYTWSRCIISSRAIHLWAGPTLVPLADFLNHRKPPTVMCHCHTDEPQQTEGGRSIYSPPSTPSSSDSDDECCSMHGARKDVCLQPHQYFICESIEDCSAGSELFWIYNSHSVDYGWLQGYGFVPEDSSSESLQSNSSSSAEGVNENVHASTTAMTMKAFNNGIDDALSFIAALDHSDRTKASGLALLLIKEKQAISSLRWDDRMDYPRIE